MDGGAAEMANRRNESAFLHQHFDDLPFPDFDGHGHRAAADFAIGHELGVAFGGVEWRLKRPAAMRALDGEGLGHRLVLTRQFHFFALSATSLISAFSVGQPSWLSFAFEGQAGSLSYLFAATNAFSDSLKP